jgi:hypothetical protein
VINLNQEKRLEGLNYDPISNSSFQRAQHHDSEFPKLIFPARLPKILPVDKNDKIRAVPIAANEDAVDSLD